MTGLLAIDAPHFYAGLVIGPKLTATRAAPIVKYMVGWLAKKIAAYCRSKGWKLQVVRNSEVTP